MVLNSYLNIFPDPKNKVFTTANMIEMLLCIISKDWIIIMAKVGIEPRTMTFQALIDHLVKFESTYSTTNTNKESWASGGHTTKKKETSLGRSSSPRKSALRATPEWVTTFLATCIYYLSLILMLEKFTAHYSVKVKDNTGIHMGFERIKTTRNFDK